MTHDCTDAFHIYCLYLSVQELLLERMKDKFVEVVSVLGGGFLIPNCIVGLQSSYYLVNDFVTSYGMMLPLYALRKRFKYSNS